MKEKEKEEKRKKKKKGKEKTKNRSKKEKRGKKEQLKGKRKKFEALDWFFSFVLIDVESDSLFFFFTLCMYIHAFYP